MWEKLAKLQTILEEMGSVVVAFSGGVDSTLLLKVAHDVLGEDMVGVLATSPTLTPEEEMEAVGLADQIGARLVIVGKREMEDPRFVANTPDRCYFCKANLAEQLLEFAEREGYQVVVDGSNVDDQCDYRPGARAAQEHGIRSPLQEAGLNKEEIRTLSREFELPTWDKPAASCLATRIPYGMEITEERLDQVGAAERVLRDLGLRELRVRHHGDVARLEVPPEDFILILAHREELATALQQLGYRYVTLDLVGFRSGSMNESLPERVLARGEV